MRSFIRSHKKTNSLDESPAGIIPPAVNDAFAAPEIPDHESLSFVQSTPPHPSSNLQGIKHSPGFESFQKLNKKMFPGKLFKKSSSSNNQLPQPTSFTTKEYSSAPGTPQANSFDIPRDGRTRNSNESKRFLAVKGTVTHSWGDNSGSEQQVIVLNNNNNGNKPQSATQPSTPVLSSDLGPAVRISSMRRSLQTASNISDDNDSTPANPSKEQSLRQNEQHHVYSELSRVKNKNRQARIHSHDDIFSLGQGSSVTMDFLKSTFSPTSLNDSPQLQNNKTDVPSSSKIENGSNLSTIKRAPCMAQRTPTVKFEPEHIAVQDDPAEDETSEYLTPDDDEDEDDDASSKFSFELNAINGRTSSVKYYSKPEPTEAMYIDDLYEDEIFDEDMHCLEDGYDDMDFPSNDLNFGEDSDDKSVLIRDVSTNEISHNDLKPLKKYKDLFALSDEDEEDEGSGDYMGNNDLEKNDDFQTNDFQNDDQTQKYYNHYDLHESDDDLQHERVKRSSAHSNNMDLSSYSTTADHFESNSQGSVSQLTSLPKVGDAPSLKSCSSTTSPTPSQTPVQSPIKDRSVHSNSVPKLSQVSTIQVPAINKSNPINQESIPPSVTKTNELPKNKVKSFSDIFDLDEDDDEEGNESEDELIRKAIAAAHGGPDAPDGQLKENFDDFPSRKHLSTHISPAAKSKAPIQIYLTPPGNNPSTPFASHDNYSHSSLNTPSLPPPARSQSLKYHDLSSNLDSEIPGIMSNLYFIDETEEDKYMEQHKLADDDYLDEINTVPEDFNFSDSEHDGPTKTSLRRSLKGSFRGTHSYSSQPTGTAKETTPTKNKLEIRNKTVTFFNNSWERSPLDRQQLSPRVSEQYLDPVDDYILSPSRTEHENFAPLTPNNSISKPSPSLTNDKSLSPIQEGSSSVDNSPRVPLR